MNEIEELQEQLAKARTAAFILLVNSWDYEGPNGLTSLVSEWGDDWSGKTHQALTDWILGKRERP
jgi:hypothetical protein